MMYTSSFFKLCLEDLKRRIVVVIVTLSLFFAYFAQFVLSFASNILYRGNMTHSEFLKSIENYCAINYFQGTLAMLMGVFLAVQGFQYLHSKRKMDFYGSLPIARSRRFAVVCTNQFLLFTIPLVVVELLKAAVIGITGFGTSQIFMNLFHGTLCMLLCFFAAWAITAFAMIGTGNIAISLVCALAIVVYVPLWRFVLYECYRDMFLDTYVSNEVADWWAATSPFTAMLKMIPDSSWDVVWTWGDCLPWMGVLLGYGLVFGVLAYLIFKRRCNEATGRAMAFPKANRIIQVLLSVPAGLLCGVISSVWVSWISIWLVIPSVIFGVCFAHLLIECIFRYNIRKIFIHKWQMLVVTAVTAVVVMVLGLDLAGYDEYLPEAHEIKAVYVDASMGVAFPEADEIDKKDEMSENLKVEILNYVEPLISNIKPDQTSLFSYDYYHEVRVLYVTNDGRVKQRRYCMPEEYDVAAGTDFYNSHEYKQLAWKADLNALEQTRVINCNDYLFSKDITLTQEESKEFCQIYKEEFLAAEKLDYACGSIEIYNENEDEYHNYYVYESFVKTLAFLKERGVEFFDLDDSNIKSLVLRKYNEYWEEEKSITIVDQEFIEKHRDSITHAYFSHEEKEKYYDVWVNVEDDYGVAEVYVYVTEELYEEILNYEE